MENHRQGGLHLCVFLRHRQTAARRDYRDFRRGRHPAINRHHRPRRPAQRGAPESRPTSACIARQGQLHHRLRQLAGHRRAVAFPGPLQLGKGAGSRPPRVPVHRSLALPARRNRPPQRHRAHPARQHHRTEQAGGRPHRRHRSDRKGNLHPTGDALGQRRVRSNLHAAHLPDRHPPHPARIPRGPRPRQNHRGLGREGSLDEQLQL